MKRVLVTGATGFIGANLARFLVEQGLEVHILARARSDTWRIADISAHLHVHHADLLDFPALLAALRASRPDLIYHAAFPSAHPTTPEARLEMVRAGFEGTVGLLEAARQAGFERFINLGSSLEYGPHPSLFREDDALAPATLRGVAKAAAGLACAQFAREQGQSVINLRIFNVYGPWESGRRLIPRAILAALRGGALDLTPPGIVHDWIHVADVVQACWLAADARLTNAETLNIGTGIPTRNEKVVDLIRQISGREIEAHPGQYPLRPVDAAFWAADITQARRLLGWQPQYTLAQGLEQDITWFTQNLARYG